MNRRTLKTKKLLSWSPSRKSALTREGEREGVRKYFLSKKGFPQFLLERPCEGQEGGSMLLRREGGFLRRIEGEGSEEEGEVLKKRRLVRGTGGGLFLQKGGGLLKKGGGILRRLWRSLRSSTPSHRPLCVSLILEGFEKKEGLLRSAQDPSKNPFSF